MPSVIFFLLSLAVISAVGLSLLMAASVSDPLRHAGLVMDRVRKGDLDVSVPVISNDEIVFLFGLRSQADRYESDLALFESVVGRVRLPVARWYGPR